jgi:hypothetical protein
LGGGGGSLRILLFLCCLSFLWLFRLTAQNSLEVLKGNDYDCHIVERLSVQRVFYYAFDAEAAMLVH